MKACTRELGLPTITKYKKLKNSSCDFWSVFLNTIAYEMVWSDHLFMKIYDFNRSG